MTRWCPPPQLSPRLQFVEPGTLDNFDLGAWVDQLYTGRCQSSSWLVKVISNCAESTLLLLNLRGARGFSVTTFGNLRNRRILRRNESSHALPGRSNADVSGLESLLDHPGGLCQLPLRINRGETFNLLARRSFVQSS